MNNLSKLIKAEKKMFPFGRKPFVNYEENKFKKFSSPNINGYSSEVFNDIQKFKKYRKHKGIASKYPRTTPMFGEVK